MRGWDKGSWSVKEGKGKIKKYRRLIASLILLPSESSKNLALHGARYRHVPIEASIQH